MAGATVSTAIALGMAMTAIQFAIGSLNDLIDAPRDMGRSDKPIPAGTVSPSAARVVVLVGTAAGLGISAAHGPTVLVAGLAGLGVGIAYDVRLKGTTWSWLPFAVGIPILPIYGWLGATGTLPAAFAVVVPSAILAGAALAIANARADIEVDLAAGTRSIAIALGAQRSWIVHAFLLLIVVTVAIATLLIARVDSPWVGTSVVAVAMIAVGIAFGRSGGATRRERAWEIEAIGVAILAAAWLAGFVVAPA